MSRDVQPASIVILKDDRLYGELIRQQIAHFWPKAKISVFQRGFDALECIQATGTDLLITGVKIDDMDGLEHLEPFIEKSLPILVLTSRKDTRTFDLLRSVRYDGLYDGYAEGMENLPRALREVAERRLYISPTMVPFLKRPKNITLDALTDKEEMVLSIIGDGSDDREAAERLSISPHTVNTHRKAIMAKLKLHHKGQLMLYALQNGYIWVSPQQIHYPGFQRRLMAALGAAKATLPARAGARNETDEKGGRSPLVQSS